VASCSLSAGEAVADSAIILQQENRSAGCVIPTLSPDQVGKRGVGDDFGRGDILISALGKLGRDDRGDMRAEWGPGLAPTPRSSRLVIPSRMNN